ncbi:DUF7282 domain-containing protein [Halosolutus gelatinilyticus]|uniref:DUF7282 domain-containing protein n=1 Tax=Halosolutus gelatinilyticus TaxID=2931975 RepID=UPI001FF35C26|nr:hypothetical protein [Halosolutus gelatinilyticus]
MRSTSAAATVVIVAALVTSVVALPLLGGGFGGTDGVTAADDGEAQQTVAPTPGAEFDLVDMDATSAATGTAALQQDQEAAIEEGVEEGVELVQSQGVEVTQEQRAAAIEGALESVAQHQEASVEQVQQATAGAVHGALIQEQRVEAEQVQYAVGGATDGALSQHQTVEAEQMQSATWGATHGAIAQIEQTQRVEVEQIQVATRGAAAGAASEAGARDVRQQPKIQEAAQGAAYGVIEQYQKITVEQRQRVSLEHVQHAAAGASAGALEGSTRAALEQEQRVEVEQYQRVTIKQIQKAAMGAAAGAIVQEQEVSVEQTQAAARGAGAGPLKQIQRVRVEQIQRISITQIQEACFGAAKGSISQSQEASVEQIQAAADGASQGVVQQQLVSIAQVQSAAVGAAEGATVAAIQQQIVEVEQIQAAAFGAGQGTVIQTQVLDVTQVQNLAQGAAAGVLVQHQEVTIEQLQIAAIGACQETARSVQYQRISVTQLQQLSQETASDTAAFAAEEGTDDPSQIQQFAARDAEEGVEEIDEIEGTASTSVVDQESDGDRVVVDAVNLSEGGFVAVYDGTDLDPESVLGVSDYLDPGEHEGVEIELDEPIESDQPIVAAAHTDTNGDREFDYADSDGEDDPPYVAPGGAPVLDTALLEVDGADDANETIDDEPIGNETDENETDENETDENETAETDTVEATLSVADQEGTGENLTIDDANASVEYAIAAEYDGERTESEFFEENEAVENETIDLEPPIEENATVDVSLVDSDGVELENETIEYAIRNETAGNETTEDVTDGDEPIGNETDDNETADPFQVESLDCSNAAVSGTFEEGDVIGVTTAFYESGADGPVEEEYEITVGEDVAAPFDGTIAYEPGDEFSVTETEDGATVTLPDGDFGVAIVGFTSPEAAPGEVDYPNPDEQECLLEVRPELPSIAVADAVPIEGDPSGAIEVTFEYENPNDAAMLVESAFVEGTTPNEPVENLEPGTDTFTVEWTPDDDAERLVWEVDPTAYDYEEVLVAETDTAGEIDPTEPAEFAVEILGTNDPVEQGEPLEVEAAVENVGGEEGTQDVELDVGGVITDSSSLSLEPGATETVSFAVETTDVPPGQYAATISSEDADAETIVVITEPSEIDGEDGAPSDGPPDDEPPEDDPFDDVPPDNESPDNDPFDEPFGALWFRGA